MAGDSRAWVELVRPANILTAWADIAAGYAVAVALGGVSYGSTAFPLLILATTGLYGGGVILNDVFDARLDASERPERPIPSGRVPRGHAAIAGAGFLMIGIVAASSVSVTAGMLAGAIAFIAVLYDAHAKHFSVLGPLCMGLCRAGNLLLGTAALPGMVESLWFLGIIPLVYIVAITAISRGEVSGGSRLTGRLALVLISSVVAALFLLSLMPEYEVLRALVFILAFAFAVIPAFARAAAKADAGSIRLAVRAGVLSLILLDAALAAGFAGWTAGLGTAALLPLSVLIAREFAVT